MPIHLALEQFAKLLRVHIEGIKTNLLKICSNAAVVIVLNGHTGRLNHSQAPL
jgi:hypothetical protein